MSSFRRIALAALLLFTLMPIMAPSLAAAAPLPQSTSTPASQPPQPLNGLGLYTQNCAPCHGSAGAGDGPSAQGLGVPPAVFNNYDAIAGKSLAELFDITKNGNMQRMMPPWKNMLTDQQIWDVVGYVWTLHTSQAEVTTGKAIYAQECATCHGTDGKGKAPAPDLTDFAQTSTVSQQAWADVLANGRNTMPAFTNKLTAAEQRAVLEYARSLSMGPEFRGPLPKGTGVISGTVTNQTTGQPFANATVELGIFDQSSLLEMRQATTDAAGFYRFTELPTDDSTLAFVTRVTYPTTNGNSYSSDPGQFQNGQTQLDLPISVYDTTTDGSGVRADRVHLIVEFQNDRAYIAELIVFSLDGNKAYVGDGTGVLHFTLPQGAENLELSDGNLGERYLSTQNGFVDTLPLPPGNGSRQILYRYELPYTRTSMDLAWSVAYPATNVNALISDVGAKVTSDKLQDQGVRQTQNGAYITLSGQNIPANQDITLHFDNLPLGVTSTSTSSGDASPAQTGTDRALLFILVGIGGLLAAGLVAVPLLRQRTAPAASMAMDRDGLIDALARLDIAHQAGELSESAYQDQRLRLKAQLLDAIRKEAGA